jgi:hypothetical protein
MAEIYGTTGIPGDSVEVRAGGTVAVSAAFTTTLGLVGGMDTANGSATPGEVTTIESSSDAATAFGEDSELKQNVDAALANSAGTIYAVPVTETTGETESFTGTQSGTLDTPDGPIFDPNVQPEHEITAQDTSEGASVTVNEVYASPPSQPSEANTININPVTREWAADESSDYDITYDYGDYTAAVSEVVTKIPRIVSVLTENTSVANDLLTELNSYDTGFDFMHGVVGAMPEVSASSYSDAFDDRRLSVVAPSRAYTDTAETNMVRTMGAVGGKQAGKALGDSTTYEGLSGFASLNTVYTNSELATLIDSQVYTLQQKGGIRVVKDMTTSTTTQFERVYVSEIVDEATEISHQISQDFIGEVNTQKNRVLLRESHKTSYEELQEEDLLEAYTVSVSPGANDFEVDLSIGLDVIGVMDTIDVAVTVGDVITNEGAA